MKNYAVKEPPIWGWGIVSFTIQEDVCNHLLDLLPCLKLDQPFEPANRHKHNNINGIENAAKRSSMRIKIKEKEDKDLLSSFNFQYLIIFQKNSKILIFSSLSSCCNSIFGAMEILSFEIFIPEIYLIHLKFEDHGEKKK